MFFGFMYVNANILTNNFDKYINEYLEFRRLKIWVKLLV